MALLECPETNTHGRREERSGEERRGAREAQGWGGGEERWGEVGKQEVRRGKVERGGEERKNEARGGESRYEGGMRRLEGIVKKREGNRRYVKESRREEV